VTRLFTAKEIAEFLTGTCPGPLSYTDPVYRNEDDAIAAWEGWVEHMEAGGYVIGREIADAPSEEPAK
jgi:hypothetical protein